MLKSKMENVQLASGGDINLRMFDQSGVGVSSPLSKVTSLKMNQKGSQKGSPRESQNSMAVLKQQISENKPLQQVQDEMLFRKEKSVNEI